MALNFDREAERAATLATLSRLPSGQRESLIAEYQRRTEAAFASDTLRSLRQIIVGFTKWCKENGYSSEPPVAPQTVAAYVEAMGGKLSSNTINTRLWAIAEYHRSRFQPSPTRHRLVELAVKSVNRIYGKRSRQAPPLCKEEVHRVLDSLGESAIELRDKALIRTATDSWCRVSELVQLRVNDIMRRDDLSSVLYIRRSKTDQFGAGDYAFLSKSGTEVVLRWIERARLKGEDPIFTKSQPGGKKTPLDPATVGRMLKRRFGRKDVSSHSFRVGGGVHDAFKLGCDLSSIMVAGRWRSPEMPARYGRRILVSQSAAARVSEAFEADTQMEKEERDED